MEKIQGVHYPSLHATADCYFLTDDHSRISPEEVAIWHPLLFPVAVRPTSRCYRCGIVSPLPPVMTTLFLLESSEATPQPLGIGLTVGCSFCQAVPVKCQVVW
jgi:hypothetical protein